MASTVTYIPTVSCCVCIQACVHTAAVVTVVLEGRGYQACSLHAPLLEGSSTLVSALRMAKKHNKIRGAV